MDRARWGAIAFVSAASLLVASLRSYSRFKRLKEIPVLGISGEWLIRFAKEHARTLRQHARHGRQAVLIDVPFWTDADISGTYAPTADENTYERLDGQWWLKYEQDAWQILCASQKHWGRPKGTSGKTPQRHQHHNHQVQNPKLNHAQTHHPSFLSKT